MTSLIYYLPIHIDCFLRDQDKVVLTINLFSRAQHPATPFGYFMCPFRSTYLDNFLAKHVNQPLKKTEKKNEFCEMIERK